MVSPPDQVSPRRSVSQRLDTEHAYRARLLDERVEADWALLDELRADPGVRVLDGRVEQQAELQRVLGRPEAAGWSAGGRWAYYPWRRAVVGVLGAEAFNVLRLDRNRNKITVEEQERLRNRTVGVVGLSVGHVIAHTLAMEGLCGRIRLADFDTIDLSNLNRIPATVFDLGVNKSVVVARRIAELDPYLPVELIEDGLTAETMPAFFDGLDVVIEECDSLDIKVLLRQEARVRRLPVLMETSDRGLFDVERFDLEPDRPLFHGLLGDIDVRSLAGLSTSDKVPHMLRLLDAAALSSRMAASMVEIDESITTWPQLGGDVVLGAATVSAAVRRLGLGEHLPSGRIRIDMGEQLDALRSPLPEPATPSPHPSVAQPADLAAAARGRDAVLQAVRLAPSGGNIQPWLVSADPTALRIYLAGERTTTMDVRYRGSYVAIGAALYNARVAASAHSMLGPVELFAEGADSPLVATLHLGDQNDRRLTAQLEEMRNRGTNRSYGRPQLLTTKIADALQQASCNSGGQLQLITDRAAMAEAGEILASADRLRYLTPVLHREMMSELHWPGRDRLDVGIDVRTLELDEADLAKLQIIRRPDVMAHLAQWGKGSALKTDTRDRIASSSALAVVTVDGYAARDFVRGGGAVEALWICAEQHHLTVQPTSPVFLYGLDPVDLAGLAEPYAEELAELRHGFRAVAGVLDGQSIALVLRLSHAPAATVRSQRLTLDAIRYRDGAQPSGTRE